MASRFSASASSDLLSTHTLDARHVYSTEHADEELQTDRRTSVPVVISYVVAILVGLAMPTLAVVLYFALAVFVVVPFSEVRRLVFQRSQL